MVSPLLYELPPSERCRVIFMQRDLDEVVDSQEQMLRRRGQPIAVREKIMEAFTLHLKRCFDWLPRQRHIRYMVANYNDLIADPPTEAEKIAEFLDLRPSVEQMLAAVDPKLYRNRHIEVEPAE